MDITTPVSAKALGKRSIRDKLNAEDNNAVIDELIKQKPRKKKVAIIGSGSAGLGAAYALFHSEDHVSEVHIFEKDDRLGGHTNTQTWTKNGQKTPVDTGFIVMNMATYPNFISFLNDIGVETKTTEMSFAVSRDRGKFEWSGSARGIFAQRRNLFRLSHWRMILDIIRFEQFAPDLLRRSDEEARSITIGHYLAKERYSQAFKDDYLIPMTAAVWSTSPDKASLEFPAQTLIRFMWNHHLLSTVSSRPDWLTIPGGSQLYIDTILKSYPQGRLRTHKMSEVVGITRAQQPDQPKIVHWLETSHCQSFIHQPTMCSASFDHIIFACHGDQILPILEGQQELRRDSKANGSANGSMNWSTNGSANGTGERRTSVVGLESSKEERDILSCFQTTTNECYLHSDLSLMPTRRATWSSWNYLIEAEPSQQHHPAGVSLTYNMNILQHIPTKTFGDVLVTMNPKVAPDPALTQGQYTYEHPVYTVDAVRAQERLETIQNKGGISYCGAWTKYGFHEDGFSSGLKVVIEHLGAKLPFEFKDSTFSRGQTPPDLTSADHAWRLVLSMIMTLVRLGERGVMLPGVSLLVGLIGLVVFRAFNLADFLRSLV